MSRFRILSVGVVLAAVMVVAPTIPAAAHDDLVASTPASGERLLEAPTEITLTYSADLMTIGAAVIVADQAGRDWVVDDPEIDGQAVTAQLGAGMPAAGYEIRWRVVSSDGHPISGIVPFTVGDGEPLVRAPATTAPDEQGAVPPDAAEDIQSTQENRVALRVVLLGAGGAVTAVALLVLISFIRRRRSAQRADDDIS